MEIKKDILWRSYLCLIGMGIFAVAIVGRVVFLQQVEGNYWRNMSDSLHTAYMDLDADRGTIYSEEGRMLSTSIPYFDIRIDFKADGLRDKKKTIFKDNVDSSPAPSPTCSWTALRPTIKRYCRKATRKRTVTSS